MQASVCKFLDARDTVAFMAMHATSDDAWRAVVCAKFARVANKPRDLSWHSYFLALTERKFVRGRADIRAEFTISADCDPAYQGSDMLRAVNTRLRACGVNFANPCGFTGDGDRDGHRVLHYILNDDYVWLLFEDLSTIDTREFRLPAGVKPSMTRKYRADGAYCFVVREYCVAPVTFSGVDVDVTHASFPILDIARFDEQCAETAPFTLDIMPIRATLLDAIDKPSHTDQVEVNIAGRQIFLCVGYGLHMPCPCDFINYAGDTSRTTMRDLISNCAWVTVRLNKYSYRELYGNTRACDCIIMYQ